MEGPHGTRRGAGRGDDQSSTHVVIDRPGLTRRTVAVLAALVLVVVVGVVLRATAGPERSAAPDGPPSTTSTSTTTTTTGPERTTTTTGFDVVAGRELSIRPAALLPCEVRPGDADGPEALVREAAPGALIPGSTSMLSWTDPDLSVSVVPGSDVVVLTSVGGTQEHRSVGRIDPATGAWIPLFDQVGCRLLAAVVIGAEAGPTPPALWLVLDEGTGTYVAEVGLERGDVRWTARADWATELIDAGDEVWVIGDAGRPSPRGMWSGQTELTAIDARTHDIGSSVLIRAAIIPADPGDLVVVQNGRVSRLDPTTGEIDARLGTIDGLYAGDLITDRAVIADGRLWNVDGYGGAARITRRALDTFVADPPQDAPCGRLLPWWSTVDGRPSIGEVRGCGTEVTVSSIDPPSGRRASSRFTTYVQYEFDRPAPVVPTLIPDTSGFWYVDQLPKPSSPLGGPAGEDRRSHLFHVATPEPDGVPLG